ncbi:MAG TPA: AI-2E family transporter [Terracidiphilus sp.]|jgi:predicted PurR-regulated permease PerM|nr:AI-2E family transporter [Terracidiphilus sp.]
MTQRAGKDQHEHRGDILLVFALGLACYVGWFLRNELVLLYVAGLLAVVLKPVVRATGRLRVGPWQPLKGKAILFLLVAVVGALTAFGFLALPPVLHDLQQLSVQAPQRVPELLDRLQKVPFVGQIDPDNLSAKVQSWASQQAGHVLLSITGLAGKLADVISGIVLTIYFILEGDRAYKWFLSLIPLNQRGRLDSTLQRASIRMGKWLLGQMSLMLILGTSSTIVFLCLHVRYAYALGVVTGLFNIVPVLGAAITFVLALIVAAVDSWGRVLGVAIFYFVYLQVENSLLTPRIMKTRVGLPALAILVALLLGFTLAGVVGALVAIPTAVLVSELLDEYMVRKPAPTGVDLTAE